MSMLLTTHVAGAAIGLIAGAASLTFRKGSDYHRLAGRAFLVAMLVAGLSAVPLAGAAGKWMDACSGVLTCYLVASAWLTLRPANPVAQIGLLALALGTLSGYLAVEWVRIDTGAGRPDVPPGAGFVFAAVLALAAIGDVRVLLGRRLVGFGRTFRHLWRMCFALFMATASFFAARPHLFPDVFRESGLLVVLSIAPLILMAYWWVRVGLAGKRAQQLGSPPG